MSNEQNVRSPSPIADFFAGTMGGMCGHFVGQPLDVVKVIIQNSAEKRSLISVAGTLWRKEGIRGFFRGVLPPVTVEGAINAVIFTTYAVMQRVLQKDPTVPLTTGQGFIAGAVAGVAETFIVCPMELVKIRIQLKELETEKVNEFTRTGRMICEIARIEGIRGFTRGFGITLAREVIFMAIYFSFYEKCKQYFKNEAGILSASGQIFSGGLAGTLAWGIIYPSDIVKTNLQASRKYSNSFTCFSAVLKENGYRGLYNGFLPCVLRAFPCNAVLFYVYELCIALSWKLY